MTKSIVCIGNAIVDVIFPVEQSVIAELELVPGSMNLIDQTRRDQLLALATDPNYTAGGSAANTAAGLAMLGSSASFIGRIADDQLGDIYQESTKQAGVNFLSRPVLSQTATGTSMILVSPDGQRTMNTFLGEASNLSVTDLQLQALASADYLFWELYLWDKASAKDAINTAMNSVKKDCTIALSLSDTFCIERHELEVADLIDNSIDAVFGNTAEFVQLYGAEHVEQKIQELTAAGKLVIRTAGAQGATAFTQGTSVTVSAIVPEQLVDSTGAGDQFAAGFLHGLIQEWELEACLELAIKAAAEVISHYGSRLSSTID